MYNFPIGVILESFRLPRTEAIKKAKEIGANGIQMYATKGENSAENLTKEKRKELLKEVKENGLCFPLFAEILVRGFGNQKEMMSLLNAQKEFLI